ncbi:pyridoxal-phosphate dependent enzyme [Solimonas flava]|uniref:pyridoxal-phosphate dependent enzyme n=1 Tax=Solimonas flava TaxID=415849 RepID=UPI0003F8A686|nr:pyridoxal-phosphate dependent enzyme [Solimonas flava]
MTPLDALPVRYADIQAAAARIRPYVHRTPVLHSTQLDALLGAELHFKCENFQRIGAFKARGAHNAVFALDDEDVRRGVATHSSGNHAAALSLAARNRGVPAWIVMPSNAPQAKIESVRRLGGRIQFCEPTLQAREAMAAELVAREGARLVHPHDDLLVIAGQGTATAELIEDVPGLDAIVAPVGGGGLMAGTAVAARALRPDIRIIATEPAAADDAYRSWRQGRRLRDGSPDTIADGLRTTLGAHGFTIMQALLDDFATASESAIVEAMRRIWQILKIVVEPSSAVALAALLENRERLNLQGARIGVILTGGNVDLDRLPW